LDALTGIAYLDDSQIAKLTIERAYDKARPSIDIEMKEKLANLNVHS
jgi:Holliday junction resolvase RusA-like endonuclease